MSTNEIIYIELNHVYVCVYVCVLKLLLYFMNVDVLIILFIFDCVGACACNCVNNPFFRVHFMAQ